MEMKSGFRGGITTIANGIARLQKQTKDLQASAQRWVSLVSVNQTHAATHLCVQLIQQRKVKSLRLLQYRCSTSSTLDNKRIILESSLPQVKEHGWSEDALAAGVYSANLPPAMIGLVRQQQHGASPDVVLVMYYMERCNRHLKKLLNDQQLQNEEVTATMTVAQKLFYAIQGRLRMNTPHLQSKRWHEAMAIGVKTPSVAFQTSQMLRETIQLILNFATSSSEVDGSALPTSILQESVISAIYIATELYMLTDSSPDFLNTWNFLHQRLSELEKAVEISSSKSNIDWPSSRDEAAIVMSALITSLGGGIFSLLHNINPSPLKTDYFTSKISVTSLEDKNTADFKRDQLQESTRINLEDLPPFEEPTK